MRKILIRIGVLVAVFFLGIFLFSHFMNIENTDRTSAMAEAYASGGVRAGRRSAHQ